MGAPTLNSVSPSSGPPGTAITLQGSGFDPGAQVGCPVLVDSVWISAGQLQAAIPKELVGPGGGTMAVSVFVQNEDGSLSTALPFAVQFPAQLQSWTSLPAVVGEVPGFRRGGNIQDSTIEGWMRSIAQAIAGAMLRRGLSQNPADWQQADPMTGGPSPAAVLELINRNGAAARLAYAVGAQFSQGDWGLAKNLQSEYTRELKALQDGENDKLFRPTAATMEAGRQVSTGDLVTSSGDAEGPAFTKGQVF